MEFIALPDCKRGNVYRLRSRNLSIGVFDGKNGFIGIREKFGHSYLFKEYHYDTGAPFGTVRPTEVISKLPDWIPIKESHGNICKNCGRMVFTHDPSRAWEHIPFDTYNMDDFPEFKPFDFGDCVASAMSLDNRFLYNYLLEIEND